MIVDNPERAPEGMVDSWEAEKEEILQAMRARLVGLPGVAAEVLDIKHPLEDSPYATLKPIYRLLNYGTRSKREAMKLSFVPKIEAFEGRAFATIEELEQVVKPLKAELCEHWVNCKEPTFPPEKTTVIAQASFTVQGELIDIMIYQVGVSSKLLLSITSH